MQYSKVIVIASDSSVIVGTLLENPTYLDSGAVVELSRAQLVDYTLSENFFEVPSGNFEGINRVGPIVELVIFCDVKAIAQFSDEAADAWDEKYKKCK